MTRYAMALDTQACIGCLACTVACKVENGNPDGIWFAPVLGQEFGTFPEVRRGYLPLLCNHCTDAPCLKACPTGAISRREDGIVLIDQDRCCGSRACVIACPYGAIHYYERRQPAETPFDKMKTDRHQPGTAQKCTLCAPRIDKGLKPACIDVCPTGARIFGDLDDPQSRVARAFAAPDAVPLGAPVDTKPNTRYLARGVRHAGGTDSDVVLPYTPQTQWGVFQTLQFWLFGVGAGIIIASQVWPTFITFSGRMYDLGAALGLVSISLGGLILIAHLGRPIRFWNAIRNWRYSWISRGAIADFAFIALVVPLVPVDLAPFRTVLSVCVAALAAIIAAYPGFAMQRMGSVPGWQRGRLPWKFLIDALLMGFGVVGFVNGFDLYLLLSIIVLAVLRIVFALSHASLESIRTIIPLGSGVIVLSIIALALPSSSGLLAPLSAALALALGLVNKWSALHNGRSPSPFGSEGELRGFGNAAR